MQICIGAHALACRDTRHRGMCACTTRHGHVCTLCVYHEGGEGEAKMRGRRQRIFRWLTVQFSWSQSNLTCRCSTWNRRGDRERKSWGKEDRDGKKIGEGERERERLCPCESFCGDSTFSV